MGLNDMSTGLAPRDQTVLSRLSLTLGRPSPPWDCSYLLLAALNPLSSQWSRQISNFLPTFPGVQELSLPDCGWIGLKQTLAMV